MKGYVIALALLLLLVAAVVWNAAYIHGVTEALLGKLDSLPSAPATDQTPAAVKWIRDEFDRQTTLLQITVPGSTIDRIRESLCLLELYAASGDVSQYAAALVLLREQVEAMAHPEKLSLSNIL